MSVFQKHKKCTNKRRRTGYLMEKLARKKEYYLVEIDVIFFGQEDIVKTSFAGDNNVGWEDDDANILNGGNG